MMMMMMDNMYLLIIGPNVGQLKTAIGDQVRLHIPVNIKDFQLVPSCFKDAIWTSLTEKFNFNVEGHFARPIVEKSYPQKLRTQRAKYRTNYLGKATNIEEAKANIPPTVNPALWIKFVEHEFKHEVKERNAKFKSNKSANKIGVALGKKDPTKKRTRVDDWLSAREHKDGTILESAKETYDKVKEFHAKMLESGGTLEDISSDALSQVLGEEKKNWVRGVGSYITKKQLESASLALASVNPSLGTFKNVEAEMAGLKADMQDIKSTLQEMMQGSSRVTPSFEAGLTSRKRPSPMESPHDTVHAFGSGDQLRVTLLNRDGREVTKGFVDDNIKFCHGRTVARGERRVYIEEVLDPKCPIYDGPQDGNQTLNAWLQGGYIIWLVGRLKYDL